VGELVKVGREAVEVGRVAVKVAEETAVEMVKAGAVV